VRISRKIQILLVEDDEELLGLFQLGLAIKGIEFEVRSATDGHRALELARENHPDLILLDIRLPGDIDGIEVCRRVRSDPDMRGVGVVMLSALSDTRTRQAAIEAGAADYWVKPVRPRDLSEKVRAILNLKRPQEMPAPNLATAPTHSATRPGLDSVIESIRATLTDLDPEDWSEIQALAETRRELKRRGKVSE
jgi:DNA-binding response OmpR family regulator